MRKRERAKELFPRKRSLLLSLTFLVCFVCCFGMQGHLIQKMEYNYPNGIVMRSSYGMFVDFSEKMNTRMREDAVRGKLARVSQTTSVITNGVGSAIEAVNLYYTDPEYAALGNVHIVRGAYFSDIYGGNNKKVCVISEDTAVRHFSTTDAVGQTISMYDKEYIICGIYHQDKGLLFDMAGDSVDSMYLPYTCAENPDALKVNYLVVSPDVTVLPRAAETRVAELMGQSPYAECMTSYPDLVAFMKFLRRLGIFLIGISIMTMLLCLAWKQMKVGIGFVQQEKQNPGTWKEGIRPFGEMGILCLASIGIFLLFRFTPEFPPSLLPSDNIFRLSYYWETLTSAMQRMNFVPLFDYTWNYSFWAGGLCIGWGVLAICFYIAAFVQGLLCIKRRKNEM